MGWWPVGWSLDRTELNRGPREPLFCCFIVDFFLAKESLYVDGLRRKKHIR